MSELLVPATKAQRDHVQADVDVYGRQMPPELIVNVTRDLQDAGIVSRCGTAHHWGHCDL
jgi:hypothetical protein